MQTNKFNNKYNIVGNTIRLYREKNNLSQEQLCAKLSLMGITLYKVDIYKIENNKRTVRDFELWGFSKVFNVPLESLLDVE